MLDSVAASASLGRSHRDTLAYSAGTGRVAHDLLEQFPAALTQQHGPVCMQKTRCYLRKSPDAFPGAATVRTQVPDPVRPTGYQA